MTTAPGLFATQAIGETLFYQWTTGILLLSCVLWAVSFAVVTFRRDYERRKGLAGHSGSCWPASIDAGEERGEGPLRYVVGAGASEPVHPELVSGVEPFSVESRAQLLKRGPDAVVGGSRVHGASVLLTLTAPRAASGGHQ